MLARNLKLLFFQVKLLAFIKMAKLKKKTFGKKISILLTSLSDTWVVDHDAEEILNRSVDKLLGLNFASKIPNRQLNYKTTENSQRHKRQHTNL